MRTIIIKLILEISFWQYHRERIGRTRGAAGRPVIQINSNEGLMRAREAGKGRSIGVRNVKEIPSGIIKNTNLVTACGETT